MAADNQAARQVKVKSIFEKSPELRLYDAKHASNNQSPRSKNNSLLQKGVELPQKTVKITNACRGQLIGWEDVVQGRKNTTNFRCLSSTGSLLTFDAKVFLRIISRDQKLVMELRGMGVEQDSETLSILAKSKIAFQHQSETLNAPRKQAASQMTPKASASKAVSALDQ